MGEKESSFGRKRGVLDKNDRPKTATQRVAALGRLKKSVY